jgi:hypothetical protein
VLYDLYSLLSLYLLGLSLLLLIQENDFLLRVCFFSGSLLRGLLNSIKARAVLSSKTITFFALHKAHHCVIADRLEVSILGEIEPLRMFHAQFFNIVHEVDDEAHVLEFNVFVVLKLYNHCLVVDKGPVSEHCFVFISWVCHHSNFRL